MTEFVAYKITEFKGRRVKYSRVLWLQGYNVTRLQGDRVREENNDRVCWLQGCIV